MCSNLDGLAQRLATDEPATLAAELEAALSLARSRHSLAFDDDMRRLHGLLRFCAFAGIVRWLQQERGVVEAALVFAQSRQEQRVAEILADALAGRPQPLARFTLILPSGQAHAVATPATEPAAGDERDWSSTDVALGFALDGFRRAVIGATVAALRAAPRLADALATDVPALDIRDRLAG